MNWTKEMVDAHNARIAANTAPPLQCVPNIILSASTDETRLNKTEKAWLVVLRRLNHPWLGIHAVTLKLGDDCRYTPDFIALGPNGEMLAWEVKGFMREDALVKLKTAARQFRWIKFILVRKTKDGWEAKEINP